ncbi:MAG: tetratricopeptide (TPR) repeat protein [Planctomycetota bacterium]
MKKLFIILFSIVAVYSFAQIKIVDKDEALATQYYSTGNYEKAVVLLEDLFNSKKNNRKYYAMLFNSLLKLNEYNQLEKIVKKQIRKYKGEKSFEIDLAYLYSQNNQAEKSQQLNLKIINSLQADDQEIRSVAYKYIRLNQSEYLLKTYEKGNKLFRDDSKFAFEMGEAFLKLGKQEQAIKYWLNFLEKNPNQLFRIQSLFTQNLTKKGFADAIETGLYEKIQVKPKDKAFPGLLIWLFTNQKDFKSALIQAKALDKKHKEEGSRIIRLAQTALQEDDYNSSIEAYQYLVEKGESNGYFKMAKSGILKARKQKVLKNNDYTNEDLLALKHDYEGYLETYGKSLANAKTIRELANLKANYLDDVSGGAELIESVLAFPNLKKKLKNELKLDLGDMYILKDDVWESVLLYAQVDKDEKDSPLGEDARFRNAKLSYYIGEFEWAQAQLLVLKGATTELIANDALDLSIFIIDNLGLDTSTRAIEMYSEAELMTIQNKYDSALLQLDKIMIQFPDHALEDNILLKKATIYSIQKEYAQAEKMLLKLLQSFSTDILADNATFMLAELYDYQLNDKIKAKAYYEKIIIDYSNSILLVDARKRYRILRGDSL